MNTRSLLSALLLFTAGFHLYGVGVDNPLLIQATKPLLMPLLAIYFWVSSREVEKGARVGILLALIFSWLGDSLLLYQAKNEIYFLLGLGAFLVAQVMYALHFYRLRLPTKEGMDWRTRFSVSLLIVFYVFINYTFWNFLGDLRIPVLIYGACLIGMVVMATIRKNRTNETSFSLIFFGAMLFMLSDCMLAVNKFVGAFSMASFWIMVTYIAAQILIVQGVLAHFRKEEKAVPAKPVRPAPQTKKHGQRARKKS